MQTYSQHVDPVTAEELTKVLPEILDDFFDSLHRQPDGESVLIGTERIYCKRNEFPKPCEVDLGGSVPFVMWNPKYVRTE